MKCLKKILLGIAVGTVSMVLAGCYGTPHKELAAVSLKNQPTVAPEPVAGLETVDREEQ
jgi:hypothetical protein